jgi:hypothetical protein
MAFSIGGRVRGRLSLGSALLIGGSIGGFGGFSVGGGLGAVLGAIGGAIVGFFAWLSDII